jgi:hypothetical protein
MGRNQSTANRRWQIAEATARLSGLNRRFNEAFKQRSGDYGAALYAFRNGYDQLAFPGGLAKRIRELAHHDVEAVEDAICFLEVDPWFFRSGYIKERILRYLKRCRLTENQCERIMHCLLRSVEGGSRRVFFSYARIAGFHANAGIAEAVQIRLGSADPEIRRRASHVLTVIHSGIAASSDAEPGAAADRGNR